VSDSNPLQIQLLEQIRRDGPLRFDQYMEQALYAPNLGYYASRERVFGEQGDFITTPGLGDFFARVIARFCKQVLSEVGGGIGEYGSGEGELSRDLIRLLGDHLESYVCIERSMARRQAHASNRVADSASFSKMPAEFSGVVLANEFLDALPARCFGLTSEGAQERMVDASADRGALCWTHQESEQMAAAVARILEQLEEPLELPYYSEWRHEPYANWFAELEANMRQGVVLITDYGYPRREYYHPQRNDGTVRCHANHQAHSDPLLNPGQQDISVDVDFTAVAELASEAGFEVLMFTTQAGFLLEYGLLEGMDETENLEGRMEQRHQIEMLTHPERMGERFRVMVLGRDFSMELPHTICQDHRNRL